MAAEAAALLRAASGRTGEVAGTVRLAASEFFGGVVLPPILARFAALHPRVTVELSLSNRMEDLLRRDADLAVRNAQPVQAALVARHLGEVTIRLFASRDYAAARGLPGTAADLGAHPLLARPEHQDEARRVFGVPVRFALLCADDAALHAALRAGVGIGYCQAKVGGDDPLLVPVLPDLVLARIPLWIATHEDLRKTLRVSVLFDHLAGELTRYVEAGPR